MVVDGDQFLPPAELAKRWRLNPETIRRMIRRGEIPAVKVGSGTARPHYRISLNWVEGYERGQQSR
jgi:excisionase family DNA binding protein